MSLLAKSATVGCHTDWGFIVDGRITSIPIYGRRTASVRFARMTHIRYNTTNHIQRGFNERVCANLRTAYFGNGWTKREKDYNYDIVPYLRKKEDNDLRDLHERWWDM